MKEFKIYAVKDELTNSFLQPTFIESEEEAVRLFSYQINTIPLWKENASDYSLYWIGNYDAEIGSITGMGGNSVKIISGHTVRKEKESDIQHTNKTSEN